MQSVDRLLVLHLRLKNILICILFREKTPEELYEKKLTMQQLNRALAKLPVKQSQHIYAHFFLGKSSREIATAENVSVRAVQKSVRAGLKRLGKILKND